MDRRTAAAAHLLALAVRAHPLPPLTAHPVALHPLPHAARYSEHSLDRLREPDLRGVLAGARRARPVPTGSPLPRSVPEAPDVPSLTIVVAPFPTPIVVMPVRGYITVWDVLRAVYDGARRGAAELRAAQGRVLAPHRAPHAYGVLAAGGPSPGDVSATDVREFMRFCTRWAGLVPYETERDVWVLRTTSIMPSR